MPPQFLFLDRFPNVSRNIPNVQNVSNKQQAIICLGHTFKTKLLQECQNLENLMPKCIPKLPKVARVNLKWRQCPTTITTVSQKGPRRLPQATPKLVQNTIPHAISNFSEVYRKHTCNKYNASRFFNNNLSVLAEGQEAFSKKDSLPNMVSTAATCDSQC